MEKKMVRISRIVGLILIIISLMVFGCRQAPLPGQTPPPGGSAQTPAPGVTAQTPPPGGSAQMPATVGTAQMPAPGVTVQTPAPAGTVPTTQAGTSSQDPNQIQVGMTPEQVQQIMGSPDQLYQKGFIEWKYSTPLGKVDVRFQNNKVTLVERH